ncbi:hypothetical protein BJF79_03805 [Actinomadura sp. CNU-125]|uniref:hypothetical protein n=1 Tax=Actinomadura sp. CNU-125 TaxID=1904961 RepID=UPI0009682EBF|nr:hypothetical protein [Actinomadura sp. CNU-125]OLT13034.1 hypothetical protein BJF79_03805 [Actinomadura sp. CNU-125]
MTDERDAMREALQTGRPVREALIEYHAQPEPEAAEPGTWCGASKRVWPGQPLPCIGPCVLRAGHDGPVHQDANGGQWTDPRPATAEDAEALCQPPRRSLLRDLTREAVDAGTYGEPAPEMAPTLREQVADLIRRWHADRATVCDDTCTCGLQGNVRDQLADAMRDMMIQTSTGAAAAGAVAHISWSQLADAALPVVEAALARARASCCEDGERTYGEMERHLTERAEKAEATVQRSREALAAFDGRGVNNFDIPTPAEVLDAWRASLDQPEATP